jgi:catalase-peroxidase
MPSFRFDKALEQQGRRQWMAWWPNALNLDILHQHDAQDQPDGPDFDYREAVKKLDFDARQERRARADDRQPGLVAGRLGPLWRPDDPHGLALCRASYRMADGRGGAGSGNIASRR